MYLSLLLTLTNIWIKYQGLTFHLILYFNFIRIFLGKNKEEMSNRLLNTLLIPSINILKKKYSQHWLKPRIHLIDLLNKSFTESHSTTLKNEDLISLTDVLLSLIEEESLLIKSSIHLLIKLINKYEFILKYIQQKQDILYKLISIDNQIYLIIF